MEIVSANATHTKKKKIIGKNKKNKTKTTTSTIKNDAENKWNINLFSNDLTFIIKKPTKLLLI